MQEGCENTEISEKNSRNLKKKLVMSSSQSTQDEGMLWSLVLVKADFFCVSIIKSESDSSSVVSDLT